MPIQQVRFCSDSRASTGRLTPGAPTRDDYLAMRMWLATLSILASQTACMRPTPVNVYRMGEKVQAGQLIYNVFETNWQAQIGEGQQARSAAHQFMIIHLTVVNSGAEPVSVPSFKLTDESGRI